MEVEQAFPNSFSSGTLDIEVNDFGGSLDNPWRTARITLTEQEEEQLYNYLHERRSK